MNQEPSFISSVQAGESYRGKGFLGLFGKEVALVIQVSIDDAHPLEKEAKIINEQFINWLKRNGDNCVNLIMVFQAHHDMADQIIDTCQTIVNQDLGFDEVIRKLYSSVGVIDPITGEVRDFKSKWINGKNEFK